MESKYLTTRAAANHLKVGVSTLKRWNDEGIIESTRTVGGHRRFARSAIEAFLRHQRGITEAPQSSADDSVETRKWVDLIRSLDDPLALSAHMLMARSRRGSWCKVADELGEAIDEIGELWARGELSVLEEHLASERIHRALYSCAGQIQVPPDAPVCLLITAARDDHTLGLSLAELCLREAGWATRWAGRGTPLADLGPMIKAHGVSMLAVSASKSSRDAALLQSNYDELARLAEDTGVALVLGGGGAWPEETPYGRRYHNFCTFSKEIA